MSLAEGLGDEVVLMAGFTLVAAITSFAWITSRVDTRTPTTSTRSSPATPSTSPRVSRSALGSASEDVVDAVNSVSETNHTNNDDNLANNDILNHNDANNVSEECVEMSSSERRGSGTSRSGETVDDLSVNNANNHNDTNSNDNLSHDDNGRSNNNVSSESIITVRLRFLDDRQREVQARLTDTVGSFRLQHFESELTASQSVRLIFNGRLLSNDSHTLAESNVSDNSVVHCLISERPATPASTTVEEADPNFELAHLCFPMLGCLLIMAWWGQLMYMQYFSTMGSAALVVLTVIYSVSFYAAYAGD